MLLYQPTGSEIAAALARAAANFPHLAGDGGLDRAASILAAVHTRLVWTDKETIWRIPSCTDRTQYWRQEANRCDCPDWRSKKTLADDQPICKHSLALRAYRYILHARLTKHIAEAGVRCLPLGHGHDHPPDRPPVLLCIARAQLGRHGLPLFLRVRNDDSRDSQESCSFVLHRCPQGSFPAHTFDETDWESVRSVYGRTSA